MRARRYRYVGPVEIRDEAVTVDMLTVDSSARLADWLTGRASTEPDDPLTFVVTVEGRLRLAPRRSEHVALAAGRDVLAAGEMTFARDASGWRVLEVTNQSTGYCPDPDCWPAVRRSLDRLGIPHPGDFTDKVVFRRCPSCAERNIVRDGDFVCALCDNDLPARWNFTSAGRRGLGGRRFPARLTPPPPTSRVRTCLPSIAPETLCHLSWAADNNRTDRLDADVWWRRNHLIQEDRMTMHAYHANDGLARQMQAQSAYDDVKKSAGIAFAFWFFLGGFGAHRFYVGHKGVGIAMLLTLGGLGLWALIDVFFVSGAVREVNASKKRQIFGQFGLPVLTA
ncbi:TM2 domain-containing protein [Actinoplanes sp. NPDC049668]|uniref:TM2 domain-containing protein n=1 Tax=unclassified Actinoplanes TaxID=2626549 RepID=UPI0033B14BD9